MSDITDHPFIAAARKHTANENSSPDEFTNSACLQFMCLDPGTRTQVLNQMDCVMSADDGASLRQKSRVMSLSRTLSNTHRAMLKASR